MLIEQIIDKQKQEIKQLNRFQDHLSVLKLNVGLTDEDINEIRVKIRTRISQCEIAITEYQNLK